MTNFAILTDSCSDLTAPLRDRFGVNLRLELYSPAELQKIVERSAGILKVEIDSAGAYEIASRSRGTPRIANRLLKRVRDYAQVRADGVITKEVANAALLRLEVDEMGLDATDRRMLRSIIEFYHGGPVGLETLAATIEKSAECPRNVHFVQKCIDFSTFLVIICFEWYWSFEGYEG